MQKRVFLMLFTVLFFGAKEAAADVRIPHEFKAGEVARASEINANFTALKEAIEQLQGLLVTLQAQNSVLEEENRSLKKHIADLQSKIEALEKQVSALTAIPEEEPLKKIKEEEKPVAGKLRPEPRIVSGDEFKEVFGLDEHWRPLKYIDNDFEVQGDMVIDHATGLMWQKSGSDEGLTYEEARRYVEQLNSQKFGGYDDWRLPTIPELLSLLKPAKQSNGLHIEPVFDKRQTWCWSADKRSSGSAWIVNFNLGHVSWNPLYSLYYVRAVRSRQPGQLRTEPWTVSEDEFKGVFGLDDKRRPLTYTDNDFEDLDRMIIDHATGLMWQKSGSDESLTYEQAQRYVEQLNGQKFGGYDDWRMPTIPELMSLLKPEKQSNGLYIDPVFGKRQTWCWSADKSSSESAWLISFFNGVVTWNNLNVNNYVRAVRSR